MLQLSVDNEDFLMEYTSDKNKGQFDAVSNDIGEKISVLLNDEIKQEILLLCGYVPSHFIHGLLAYHCSSETGYEAGRTKINNGDQVKLMEESSLYKFFAKSNNFLNDFLYNWRVLEVYDNAQSGYLGIIYINEVRKQLVLAHRSTNFKLSVLTSSILKQSGLQQDIYGILMGNILIHQGHGYELTSKAVNFVKNEYRYYALSFTGHSLGGWLADLSVFYCHDVLDYPNVLGVTFDGPGSYEMIKKMISGAIHGSRNKVKVTDLEIVAYMSAPNLVNCTNKHVGTVYKLFPDNKDEKILPEWVIDSDLLKAIVNQLPGEVSSIFGHYLELILQYFDPYTEKPFNEKCMLVKNWPTISYKSFEKGNAWWIMDKIKLLILRTIAKTTVIQKVFENIVNLYGIHNTTIESIAHLFAALYLGKIDLHQFWLVHKNDQNNIIDQFYLQYEAQYQVENVNYFTRQNQANLMDRFLNVLVNNNQKVQGKTLYAIANICQYRVSKKQFEIKNQYRKEFTMDHIVGCIRAWWCREPDFEIKLNSIANFKQLKSNLDIIDLPNMEVEVSIIVKLFESSKVVIVKGMSGTGKTALVQSYAQNFKQEFVTQLLLASSKEVLKKSLKKCTKSMNLLFDGKDDYASAFKNHLNDSKQNVLFILDDVKDFAHVVKFITTLIELYNVRIIVTTQHDQLLKNESSERSDVSSTLYDCISEMNLNYSLKKFSVNYNPIPIVQTIMDNIDSKDMKCLYSILPCIKPNTLSKSNLTEILEYFTNLESARNCIDKLESLSLITTNKNQNITVCEQVQEIALENFKLPTVLDSIKLFSRFRSDNILEKNIFLILSYYDLDEYIAADVFNQLIINIGIAEMAHLVNIFSKLLQKHDIESKSAKFLKEIFSNLKKDMEEKLQLLFSSLADDWKNILYEIDNIKNKLKSEDDHTVTMMTETIKSIEKKFLRSNQITIENFLVAFNAFYETSTGEFTNTIPEKCLQNIFVTGVTGSGKSTAINYMIGNHLECKKKGVVGKCTIEVSQQNGNDVAVIGNVSTSSETTLIKPYYNKENSDGLIFWDCPGFLDSHGNIARIRNAFLINYFGKNVLEYKILLVVDSSEIFAAKGGQFVELLRKIKSIYPNFNISKSLCLLITKGESYDKDVKKEYTDQFSELAEAHKECEEILNYFSSGNGISFFPKVKKGEVTENSFKNINVIKTGDTLCHKTPAIIIDQETSIKLTTINNLLNQYAHFIIEENVSQKVREITNMIQKYTFKKSDIPINNYFAQLSHPIEAEQFLKKLKSISYFHETVTSVENVLKTLRFFNILNNSLEVNLEKWVTSFITLDKLYSALREEPNAQAHPDGGIEIKVPILSATEIQNLYKKFKLDIRAASFLFIFDNNLKLPSVNLSIASCEWRILNDKEISLNGDDSKNSGSFYGIAKNVSGGKVTFLLNGCDGSNGKLDLSGIENSLFTMDQEILNLESSLYMLQHIKYLKKQGLDKELDSLQNEKTKEDEEETEESANAKKNRLNFIKELKKLEDIVIQYENIPQQYLLVKKLIEEGNTQLIGNDAESLSIEDFKIAVEKQRENINKVEKKLKKSSNTKELLQKTKNISSDLADTVYQYDKEYRKHRKVVKEYFYDRLLCLNEFQVKLNGQKWIKIDKEEETVKNLIKEIKESKGCLEKNMNDLKTDVENFNNVSEKRRKCEREKEELKKIVINKQEDLKQMRSLDLFQKVENLTKTADERAKITKLWNDEVGRKDIIFPGSDEQFVPANREILNRIEDMDEFLNHCLNEKNSLEKEKNSDVFRNITHESEELYKVKTKINIVEIKKCLNYFIDIYKLEIVKCDLSTDKDTEELQEELQNTKKKLWAMEHYLGTIRSKLPFEENKLDIWIKQKLKMKKSLVERLENATKYYEKVLSIYNEFKIKEQLHKIAENEYSMYTINECLGKNAKTADFANAYNKFIEIDKEITKLINEEAKIVTKMLKYKFNLFERIERKFKDREFWSKIAYVAKELLVFNKQYYEKYKLSGSNGNKGSNSGGFHFDGSENHVERVEQKIGKGGKNADALEGIYISEYSFSTIRRISEKRLNKEKIQDHVIAGTPCLFPAPFIFQVAKRLGFRGISLGSLTCGSFITQLTISPIVAQLSSTLINGPYKTDQGNAKDGQNEQVKESQMIWKKEFLNYISNPEMQDVSLLFPQNNKT